MPVMDSHSLHWLDTMISVRRGVPVAFTVTRPGRKNTRLGVTRTVFDGEKVTFGTKCGYECNDS